MLTNHVPNFKTFHKNMMERCDSSVSLPQAVIRPAKRSLVKNVQSDHETNYYNLEEQCRPKKLRLNKFNHSDHEVEFERETMSPSVENETQLNLTGASSQEDLWTCIQSNYKFLMADDLIEECKETREELHLLQLPEISSSSSSSSSTVIFTIIQFKEKFNRLHDSLHSLQMSSSHESLDEKQIQELSNEYRTLKEQAEILKLMNPDLIEDIGKRINILSNKWKLLERVLYPQRAKERDGAIKELATKMKDIRQWLQEVEDQLRKLKITRECDANEMNEVFNKQKNLQREIEGRGQELTSIVRQCLSLEGATAADSKRLRRAATHLERSWHNIWIRSLEKQCLTEQRLLQQQQNDSKSPDSSDIDTDEGPLNKHRRLSLHHWTAVTTPKKMDKNNRSRDYRTNDILQKSPTRDIGVLCSNLVPVNDKCIMVGTTGIAALKAEYGDDFTNFEIIQDVGYSSESSTHLSSDDSVGVGGNRYFNIRVYKYLDDKSPKTNISLKEELENACAKQLDSLSSSVDSSSGRTSFNDSGIGNTDIPPAEVAFGMSKEHLSSEEHLDHCGKEFNNEEHCLPGDESDYLETVLATCSSFSNDNSKKLQSAVNELDELPFSLSGIDSDDAGYNFHDRTSFTKPAQVFYKMISVDSDNGENEIREKDTVHTSCTDNSPCEVDTHKFLSSSPDNNIHISENIDSASKKQTNLYQKVRTSTPVNKKWPTENCPKTSSPQNLKRKRYSDNCAGPLFILEPIGLSESEVRSWVKSCTAYRDKNKRNKSLFRFGESDPHNEDCYRKSNFFRPYDDISSCDASGEYTSSSADEDNNLSSSPGLDETLYSKEILDSYSMEGSVETVIRNLSTSFRTDSDTLNMSQSMSHVTSPANLSAEESKYCDETDRFDEVSFQKLPSMSGKAFSDSDLKSFFPSNQLHKQREEKPQASCRQKFSNSLPNVLIHRSGSSTEDANESLFSDTKRSRYSSCQSRKSCLSLSANMSSSSDLGKRKRRRKKSSSSARSSRSALNSSDNGRHRSKTLTNSLSGCSKIRHYSQQSTFLESSENNFFSEDDGSLSEVKISRTDDKVRKNLSDDFARSLDDSCNDCVNSEFLSPAESDVVLTHLDEQSTVSDQVWDGYQEMPYLSEGYSEATVDEDAVRKLTEFGDDYGSALRFIEESDCNIITKDSSKSPKKASKFSSNHCQRINFFRDDSDSDSEDLHHVIEEAKKALQFARTTIKKGLSDDFFTSAEYAELLATCGTHLKCLQTICQHIENDENVNNFSVKDLEELHRLIEEWEALKASVEMISGGEDYVKHKYVKAKKNIDNLFNTMSEISSITDVQVDKFSSWEELKDKVLQLQTLMTTLQNTKEQLLAVNLEVHRFMTEHGTDLDYKNCSLKSDVTELYQRWDDIYENNEKQLTSLELIFNSWNSYNDKLRVLRNKVKLVENSCDKHHHIPDKEELEKITQSLIELQKDSALLKEFLKGGATWKSIDLELRDLAERINKHTRTQLTSRRTTKNKDDDSDDNFENAMQAMEDRHMERVHHTKHGDIDQNKDDPTFVPKGKTSRFWRMIRIAVPVQFALVLLYCLACCLEPNCCDMLNNFNFSLSPHLRYWRGPPPA